jgi:hypothetical protein
VHAGLRDIKCVQVPHEVNQSASPAGVLEGSHPFFRLACGLVAGSNFSPHPGKKDNSP